MTRSCRDDACCWSVVAVTVVRSDYSYCHVMSVIVPCRADSLVPRFLRRRHGGGRGQIIQMTLYSGFVGIGYLTNRYRIWSDYSYF